jgi:hypothetical protein
MVPAKTTSDTPKMENSFSDALEEGIGETDPNIKLDIILDLADRDIADELVQSIYRGDNSDLENAVIDDGSRELRCSEVGLDLGGDVLCKSSVKSNRHLEGDLRRSSTNDLVKSGSLNDLAVKSQSVKVSSGEEAGTANGLNGVTHCESDTGIPRVQVTPPEAGIQARKENSLNVAPD